MSDFIDEFHKAVSDWVDHLGLEGEERDQFIDFCMEKKGYERATTWNAPQPDPNESAGNALFSRKKTGAPGAGGGAAGKGKQGAGNQYFRQGR